jgi:hypothetical protein
MSHNSNRIIWIFPKRKSVLVDTAWHSFTYESIEKSNPPGGGVRAVTFYIQVYTHPLEYVDLNIVLS